MASGNWIDDEAETLQDRLDEIKHSMSNYKFLNINTLDDLLDLRAFIFSTLGDGFFKSEKHMRAFMILNYNPSFNEKLSISRRCYVDPAAAKSWAFKLQNEFHPDKNAKNKYQDYDITEVSQAINKIYATMVGKS